MSAVEPTTTELPLPASENAERDTSESIRKRICAQFPADRYAVLFEVRNATGFAQKRRDGYCDALVMGLWPSRGLELWGMEIKVSRSDWLRELKKPEKAEEFLPYCHRWFVVAPADCVQPGELPPTWGHMAPYRNTLKTITPAPALTSRPADVGLLASICRSAADNWKSHPSYLAAREAMEFEIKQRVAEGRESERRKFEHLAERMADFELASGVTLFDRYTLRELIHAKTTPDSLRTKLQAAHAAGDRSMDWRGIDKIGAAVGTVLDGGVEGMREQLEELIKVTRNVADHAEQSLTRFDAKTGAE